MLLLAFHFMSTLRVQRAKHQFIFLTQENLDSLECVRLQLDHNASRACNYDALRFDLIMTHFARVLSRTKKLASYS